MPTTLPFILQLANPFVFLDFFFFLFYNQFHWRDVTDPEPHAYIYIYTLCFRTAQCADAALIFLDSDVLPPFFPALPGSLFKGVNQMPWKNIGNDSCHRDLLICDSDSNNKEGQQQAATCNSRSAYIVKCSEKCHQNAPIQGCDASCCYKCPRKKEVRKGHSVWIIYDNRWMAGALALWANTTSAPCASHCATADGVCVTLGKNPLCQNSFPAQEN